jgi:hypothetical protein
VRIEGVAWSAQRTPTAVNLDFLDSGAASFLFKQLLNYPRETEWTPFQTHYFSENLASPGIEPGISGSVAKNSDHQTIEVVNNLPIIHENIEKLF